MEAALLIMLAYFQVGHALALIHAQLGPISQPSYQRKPGGYFIYLVLWPFGSRRYRVAWFFAVLGLTYFIFAFLDLVLAEWIENLFYRLGLLFVFALTPVSHLVLSILFAALRGIFSFYKFKGYFAKALLQKLTKRQQVNAFIMDKDPLVQGEALRPSLMELMPGAPKRSKVAKWAAQIFFFVDSITWLAGFLQTLSGDSKDLHSSNIINEETAVRYASQITRLSRE